MTESPWHRDTDSDSGRSCSSAEQRCPPVTIQRSPSPPPSTLTATASDSRASVAFPHGGPSITMDVDANPDDRPRSRRRSMLAAVSDRKRRPRDDFVPLSPAAGGSSASLLAPPALLSPNGHGRRNVSASNSMTSSISYASTLDRGVGGADAQQRDDSDDGGKESSMMSGSGSDEGDFVATAGRAMDKLKELRASEDWKRALNHRSGVQVFVSKKSQSMDGKIIPVFKGEGVIKGYSPAAVFAVVGTRRLWDDWYEEGNLVANLDGTTSLTYMCMKGIVGSSTRDISLVEKVQGTQDGTIYFCATSVDTPRVPRVAHRTRANIALNGWIMEPVRVEGKPGTKVSYYLQADVKTFVPSAFSSRYMARRPLCITKIDSYLQKNGAPKLEGVDPAETEAGQGGGKGGRGMSVEKAESVVSSSVGGIRAAGTMRKTRRNSALNREASRGANGTANGVEDLGPVGVPAQAPPDTKATSWAEVQTAKQVLQGLMKDSEADGTWSAAQDDTGAKIWMKRRKGDKGSLPVVKGESSVAGVSTEQALMTVMSRAAARIWDDRLAERKTLELHGGHGQGVYLESTKGVYPHLGPTWFSVARGVEREDPLADHGSITALAKSTDYKVDPGNDHDDGRPEGVEGTLQLSGWAFEPLDSKVAITHVSHVDLNHGDRPLPAFLFKILVGGMASGPRKVREFIEQRGHAPGFVRWAEGEARLFADDGDLERGEAEWTVVGGGQKPKTAGDEQVAWFQWSSKMYPKGIDLTVEPASAATVTRVQGLPRTLQFIWGQIPKEGVRVAAKRAAGEGAGEGEGRSDDATVNGIKIAGSAAARPTVRGSGTGTGSGSDFGSGAAKKRAVKRKPVPAELNGNAVRANVPADLQEGAENHAKCHVPNGVATAEAGADVGAGPSKASAPPAGVLAHASEKPGRGQIPSDAMLIITQDLYFTQPQVLFMLCIVTTAFLYGRLG